MAIEVTKERKFVDGLGGRKVIENKVLSCSNCSEELAVLEITEKVLFPSYVQALCPFCGDHSYICQTEGLFNVGSIDKKTQLMDFDEKWVQYNGDSVLVHIIKLSKDNEYKAKG